eukprot:Gregarina_sp_Poly_1__2378@NODE_1637_length_3654_cov_81_418734_g1067_i1_p3_GENE_NODE_1637_length_3654_cov_81_418734_g1067_i1NODE_1637_length_3654_cov_81_418734_g1067_i1_p3_ORF_typecomplete_len201_score29_70Rtf2/PF04641_12/0_044DUF859/PF05895_12/0_034WbqC/PF08889_11/0_064_NODE_1637_length_3654_cov_81_418734_g1067_i18161418
MQRLETTFGERGLGAGVLQSRWLRDEGSETSAKATHDLLFQIEGLQSVCNLKFLSEMIAANTFQNKWICDILQLELTHRTRSKYSPSKAKLQELLDAPESWDMAIGLIDKLKSTSYYDAEGKDYWTNGVKSFADTKKSSGQRWLLANELMRLHLEENTQPDAPPTAEARQELERLESKGLDEVVAKWVRALLSLAETVRT